ncbi:oxidoreductase YdbC [Mycolicibacterium farcinogenes]|nr:oxidoreductase YdbC [Mycolicibacterium farcinogenes]
MTTSHPGGTGAIGEHTVARIGYGAMGLGPEVPHDVATAVLRRAVELGVNHIDTASFYHDGVVNRRIRDALAPYAEDLLIVSKVGARPATGPVPLALAQHPADLRAAVELDLTGLGLDQIPVVNLRRADLGPGLIAEGDQIVDLDDQLAEMITLRDEGKIGAIGISNVDLATLRRALPAGIVCVQNAYSLLNRSHEDELALCRAEGIAWVPFFPLGSAFPGFPKVAEKRCGATDRRGNRCQRRTGRAGLAARPCAQHHADRRNRVDAPPGGEPRGRQHHTEPTAPGRPRRRRRAVTPG